MFFYENGKSPFVIVNLVNKRRYRQIESPVDFKAKALIEIIMKLNLCLHADNLCTAFAVDAQVLNVGRFEWSFREVA